MKRSILRYVALGAVVLATCACAGTADEGSVEETSAAIVGGNEAWLDSAVAIATTQCDPEGDNPAHCSGLLISPTLVLTAAHCVFYRVAGDACPNAISPSLWQTFSVAVGCHDLVDGCPAANWIPLASEPIIYPGDDHDLAVLRLAAPVSVKPMRLASPGRLPEIVAGNDVTLYGWGQTAETGPISAVLRSLTRSIYSIPFNRKGFTPQDDCFDTETDLDPYVGANHGDSGGPALVFRDGEWFSLGVIQGGGYNSSHTNHELVPYYFSWILSQASDFPAQSLLPSAQILSII